MPADSLTTDVRLLLAADEMLRGRSDRAQSFLVRGGDDGDLSFIAPYMAAWADAERRNLAGALTTLEQIQPNAVAIALADGERKTQDITIPSPR